MDRPAILHIKQCLTSHNIFCGKHICRFLWTLVIESSVVDKGSARIGIILLDPHPGPADLDPVKFNIIVQNIENYDTYDADQKDKTLYCRLALLGTKVKVKVSLFWFSNMCKTLERILFRILIRIWIAIKW